MSSLGGTRGERQGKGSVGMNKTERREQGHTQCRGRGRVGGYVGDAVGKHMAQRADLDSMQVIFCLQEHENDEKMDERGAVEGEHHEQG